MVIFVNKNKFKTKLTAYAVYDCKLVVSICSVIDWTVAKIMEDTFWLIGQVTSLLLFKDSSSGEATPKRKVSRSDAHSRTLYEHPL